MSLSRLATSSYSSAFWKGTFFMMGEPPSKEYQAYNMQEGKPVQSYQQVGQQETDIAYDQQETQQPSANPFRAAPSSNPFRS